MKRFSLAVLFSLLSLMLIATVPAVAQQEDMLEVHINKPVAIPGTVLPAGSYIFRLLDNATYPDTVAISSADGSRVIGLFQAFAAHRENASGSKLTVSRPDEAGLAHVKAWYFPGEKDGYRFIYSRKELRKSDLLAQNMEKRETAGM